MSPEYLTLRTTVMLARPRVWFVTAWLYLWPTGGHWHVFKTLPFYIGLLVCTFPLNLLMFGMNDMVDFDVDQLHSRKGNFTWGARASKSQLAQLPPIMALSIVCPMAVLVVSSGSLKPLKWGVFHIVGNILYNVPPISLGRRGPWELPCMLVISSCYTMFSCDVNNVPIPSIGGWVFHWLAMTRSHFYGELIDIDDDAQVGKNTTAVKIGKRRAVQLMLALSLSSAVVSYVLLGSVVLTLYYVSDILLSMYSPERDTSVNKHTLPIFYTQVALVSPYILHAWSSQVLA